MERKFKKRNYLFRHYCKISTSKFYTIITDADIVITNFKFGDDKKLKLDYPTLKAINPTLIMASINGFGINSPRTAYDLILQAESGFMFMNGEENSQPVKMPVALIDLIAAHQLKEAILIALIHRYKTKMGSHIAVSLLIVLLLLLLIKLQIG